MIKLYVVVIAGLISLSGASAQAAASVGATGGVFGSGVADGILSVVFADAQDTAKMLPPGLSLAPETVLPNGTTPVAMFIGQHLGLKAHVLDFSTVIAERYNEVTYTVIVIDPYDASKRYFYTAKIVVDSLTAKLMGNAIGFPKRMAKIVGTKNSLTAQMPKGGPAVHATWIDVQNFDQETFKKNFETLMGNSPPTIGYNPKIGFVCFDFKWKFAEGEVSPVEAQIKLSADFVGHNKVATDYTSPSQDKSIFGSTRIKTPWEIANLRGCK